MPDECVICRWLRWMQ